MQDDEKDILYSESGSEEEFSENEEDEGEECCGVQLDVENTQTGENSPYNSDEVDDDILLDDLLTGGQEKKGSSTSYRSKEILPTTTTTKCFC